MISQAIERKGVARPYGAEGEYTATAPDTKDRAATTLAYTDSDNVDGKLPSSPDSVWGNSSIALFSDSAQTAVAYRHHGRGHHGGGHHGGGNHSPAPNNHPRPAPNHPAPNHPRPAPHHPVPHHYPRHHHNHPDYYRHYHYYPVWHRSVVVVTIGGHPRYSYNGGSLNIGSVSGLEREKQGIDYAKQDLRDDYYRYGRNSSEYRRDVEDVVNSYGYLLERVFNWGDRYPGDNTLYNYRYQDIVRDIWRDMLDTIRDFERDNPRDRSLRDRSLDSLYWSVNDSRLARTSFYDQLVDDIRRAR